MRNSNNMRWGQNRNVVKICLTVLEIIILYSTILGIFSHVFCPHESSFRLKCVWPDPGTKNGDERGEERSYLPLMTSAAFWRHFDSLSVFRIQIQNIWLHKRASIAAEKVLIWETAKLSLSDSSMVMTSNSPDCPLLVTEPFWERVYHMLPLKVLEPSSWLIWWSFVSS